MSYIYAITFSSGVTKFGRTVNLRSRLIGHDRAARRHSDSSIAAIATTTHNPAKDEKTILDIAKSRYRSIEGQSETFMCGHDQADRCFYDSGFVPIYLGVYMRNGLPTFEISEDARSPVSGRKVDPVNEERILRVVSSNKDGVSQGVLLNRFKVKDIEYLSPALEDLISKGLVKILDVIHPKNGKTYRRYMIVD